MSDREPRDRPLLEAIDAYLDAVPRSAATAEAIGPLTLFVRHGRGWPYYARPTPGGGPIEPSDIGAVRTRQRELAIPETFEWIEELAPTMGPAAAASGLFVQQHPLMDLPGGRFRSADAPDGVRVRLVQPGDDLRTILAVPSVAFANPGAQPGPVGVAGLREVADRTPDHMVQGVRERLVRGLTVTAAAFEGDVPVAVGSHQPVGATTEVVGVGVLPAFRRRGLGAAVTSALVADALSRGVSRVFLSAGDRETARVYERLGFATVGTAGAAEPFEVDRS